MGTVVTKIPNPLAIQVGARVRILRKQRGMKQEALAMAVGYGSRSGIASIEAGEVLPPVEKAIEIARVLCVNVGELLGDALAETLPAPTQVAISRCKIKSQAALHMLYELVEEFEKISA